MNNEIKNVQSLMERTCGDYKKSIISEDAIDYSKELEAIEFFDALDTEDKMVALAFYIPEEQMVHMGDIELSNYFSGELPYKDKLIVNSYIKDRMDDDAFQGEMMSESNDEEVIEFKRDKRNFKDADKMLRHTFDKAKLKSLYKQLEDFIADITYDEAQANKEAIIAIKTMIHQHMRNAN